MARPSNHDIIARYRKKISASKKWRKEESYDETWKRLIDLYRGRHYEHFTDEDRILVNMAFSTINVIAPSMLSTILRSLLTPLILRTLTMRLFLRLSSTIGGDTVTSKVSSVAV